jgi:hypothetical protein
MGAGRLVCTFVWFETGWSDQTKETRDGKNKYSRCCGSPGIAIPHWTSKVANPLDSMSLHTNASPNTLNPRKYSLADISLRLEPNFGGTSFRELADRSLTMMLAVEVWESGGVRIAITFGRRRLSGFDAASCCSRR